MEHFVYHVPSMRPYSVQSSWFRFAADMLTALFISIIMLISRRPMISKVRRQV